MQKLYIVRHGKTDWNTVGLLQGRIDISLNKEGREELKRLSNIIDLNNIDLCLCSPLKRAKETAKIIIGTKKQIIYDDLLLERNFGIFEGQKINMELISKEWDYKLNYKGSNIESITECLNRAKTFLDKISKEYPKKNLLIISHGSFIKALHFNIIGYNEDTDFLSFNPQNATLYEYDF